MYNTCGDFGKVLGFWVGITRVEVSMLKAEVFGNWCRGLIYGALRVGAQGFLWFS